MSLKSICVFMILECFYSLLLLLKKKVVFTVFYVYDYIIQSSEQRWYTYFNSIENSFRINSSIFM